MIHLTRSHKFFAEEDKMPASKRARSKNKHHRLSLEPFSRKEGLCEKAHAAALKRSLAGTVSDAMKDKDLNKSNLAARMRTSRAAIHRLLDPENTSVTLATLNRAARSLGYKVKVEFVPA